MENKKMDSNSWITCPSLYSSSSPSRRFQTQTDLEGEENLKSEFICPFCTQEFDIVEMCCHIDEQHPLEAKNGVCPVCTKRVGLDIVGHITTQHGNFFKVQRKRRLLRRGGYNSPYLILKKDLKESNLQSLLKESNIDSDPLLSSFLFTSSSPSAKEFTTQSALHVTQEDSVAKISPKNTLNSDVREVSLSREDQEKVKKREFVQGLLLSAILDDNH